MSQPVSDGCDDVGARLERLERRVGALETSRAGGTAPESWRTGEWGSEPSRFWALDQLRAQAPRGGAVLFTGLVNLPGGERYEWQQAFACDELLESDLLVEAPT